MCVWHCCISCKTSWSLVRWLVHLLHIHKCSFRPVQTKIMIFVEKWVRSGHLFFYNFFSLSSWYDSSIVYCCISSFAFWSLLRWLVQDVDIRSTWITNRKQVSLPVCHNIASMQDLNRRIRCSGRQNNLSHLYQVSRESVNCGSIGQSPICLS